MASGDLLVAQKSQFLQKIVKKKTEHRDPLPGYLNMTSKRSAIQKCPQVGFLGSFETNVACFFDLNKILTYDKLQGADLIVCEVL